VGAQCTATAAAKAVGRSSCGGGNRPEPAWILGFKPKRTNLHEKYDYPIQEHFMLRRAIERGVSPERLAKALSVDVSHILKKMNLLEGICPEAAELLEDRQFSAEMARVVRKMKPTRQIECIELMTSANNMTVAYAEALLAATPAELLVDGKKPRKLAGVTKEQMARMEREMSNLQGQYRLVEQTYGQDVLSLVLARGYLAKLLENAHVAKYLRQRTPEILEQFESIAAAATLEG
jgi:hypothetical protein